MRIRIDPERDSDKISFIISFICDCLLFPNGVLSPHNPRRNEYTAVVSEAEYQEVQTQDFLEKVYECDAKGLVATLLQKDLLSCEDYEDLKRHWEKGGSHK